MELRELLAPWRASLVQQVPGLTVFDAHTHVGVDDPDGVKQTFAELVDYAVGGGLAGCFTFPFHEPAGYPGPNDAVREAAQGFSAAHPDGPSIVPFCRVNPWDGAVAEAQRSLDLGARGIKLHPRAEAFGLDHPVVREIFAVAHERGVPVLIHSGRGIEAPGEHIVKLAAEFTGARVILAHAGATDLSWLWRVAPDLPNLLFDSAWWMGRDLIALFTLIAPSQIVFATDAPYGAPGVAAVGQLRICKQVGLTDEQIRLIFSGQSLALAAGGPLEVAGPAVGERDGAPHVLLDRVADYIRVATMLWIRGGDGSESLSLARQAANVPDSHDDAPVFAAILSLFDAVEAFAAADPESRDWFAPLVLTGVLAHTPDVALPSGLE